MAYSTGGKVLNGNSPAMNWNSLGTNLPLVTRVTTSSKCSHNEILKNGRSKVGK